MNNLQQIHHLLSRAAFGPSFRYLTSYMDHTSAGLVIQIFKASQNYTDLDAVVPDTSVPFNLSSLTEEEKRALRKRQREQLLNLNKEWIVKMSTTDAVLREKMTLFWHDHFACSTKNPFFAQDLNNILRRNALGGFGTMLLEVSKSPAMLQYLNNQQNKAKSPNENFAREVMELFTLGRDNYTENDIKNAARAFTGWGFDRTGRFVFRKKQHDHGIKMFMGYKGDFGGEDILKILLENRRTARYITEKIYKYFVNEIVDPVFLDELSAGFYNSGYDIEKLMFDIFSSDKFYEDKNINNLVKSPAELIVGYGRLLPIRSYDKKSILRMQRALGQVLFVPPNVGGWPYGREWINSTSITYRMQLPYTFINSAGGKKKNRWMTLDVDWNSFFSKVQHMDSDDLAILILGRTPTPEEKKLIFVSMDKFSYKPVRRSIQTISWLCLPEYQLA